MFRKTLSTIILLFLLVFAVPKAANAQTFRCAWAGQFGCGVNPTPACPAGSTADTARCNAFTSQGQSACQNAGPFNCTTIAQNNSPVFTDIETKALPGFKFVGGSLGNIITAAIPYLFTIAGILLLIYLLYGGFHLMISGGDPKVISEAKGKITNALVGFIIIFVAYWLVQIIARVLGLEGITNIFGG